MLFNSLEFLAFLIIFLVLWPMLRRQRNRRWLGLVAASFFFYGWWDWRFLFLLLGSGMVDFFAAGAMQRFPQRKKVFLLISIAANVGTLAVFKYFDFAIGNLNALLPTLGIDAQLSPMRLMLPIGISFYTFQSMSYTIDVYRGQIAPTHNVLHFFAYLAMFPQLVAGPVVRASSMLDQLDRPVAPTERDRWEGLQLMVRGFFKKMVIADGLAPLVAAAFDNSTVVQSAAYWWIIMAMFAFQIYGDFSGYSDIARGIARWMGYHFPLNFNHPYLATSFRDFWSRWHISLSTWFRDYVYVPLGGSQRGTWRNHANLWATMLISGLWHGAAWTFVAWGAVHAACLSLERITNWPRRLLAVSGGRHLAALVVFATVLLSWVFFRATSFTQAGDVLAIMFGTQGLNTAAVHQLLHWRDMLPLAVMLLYHGWLHVDPPLPRVRWAGPVLQPAALALLIWCCVYLRGPGNAFIYFQF